MKKFAVGLMVYMVLLAALRVEAVKQRIPINITGQEVTDAGKSRLVTSNFLSAADNKLVLAIDLDANTAELEEWDSTLSNLVDRQPDLGTQAQVYASFLMSHAFNSRSNTVTFACDMEGGDEVDTDWDDDGNLDHFGDLGFQGVLSYKATTILTNINDNSMFVTGAITRVSASVQGVLNDSVHGSNGVDRVMQRGRARSIGRTGAFYSN